MNNFYDSYFYKENKELFENKTYFKIISFYVQEDTPKCHLNLIRKE